MWQWWNFCTASIPHGKRLLKINVDETSICLFQGNVKGNVLVSKKRRREDGPVQRIPRSRRRCYLTHVAFVCDQPELQALLPQVVIGNQVALPASAMPTLTAACPSNVRLVRQKSAWNNQNLMALIIRILAAALGPYKDRFQPVLLLDAVRLHFAQAVLNACNSCGIWLVLVPAKTTWLLQPLDTHAFQSFKIQLRNAYQRARVQAGRHDLSVKDFLACIYEAIHSVLEGRDWSSAFNENGFGHGQAETRAYIKRQLGVESPLVVASARPSLEQLQCVFPGRTVVPTAALWRPFDPVVAPKAKALPGMVLAPKPFSSASPSPVTRLGRTRSEHKRAETEVLAAAASSSAEAKSVPIAHRLKWCRPKAVIEC